MSKNVKIRGLIIIIATVLVSATIGFIAFSNSPAQRLKRQLDLGQKYLNELDYEKAVAAFKEALEIAPGDDDAKDYLVSAYSDWIIELSDRGETDRALTVLSEAMAAFPDNETLTAFSDDLNEELELKDTIAGDDKGGNSDGEATNVISFADWGLNSNSWEFNGIPLKESSFDTVLGSFGLEVSEGSNFTDWNGLDVYYGAHSSSGDSLAYFSGTWHDSNGNEAEATWKNVYVNGGGVNVDYASGYFNSGSPHWELSINTMSINGFTQASAEKIKTFTQLPFVYGNYDDMNNIFHAEEIMQKAKCEHVDDEWGGYDTYCVQSGESKRTLMRVGSEGGDGMHYEFYIVGVTIDIYFDAEGNCSSVTYHGGLK